ncbi:hypothetical protein GCM10007875_04590 [Limnobacter litoralis]|uniref:Uncharacterized protein n=1 Tax=Limnobacter litoralis TaxID=481366 RepID=A0ABQ5YPG4_9BURK|nr:hypothetical protein GCM10007875_04590 [Limnobacter litoralis]
MPQSENLKQQQTAQAVLHNQDKAIFGVVSEMIDDLAGLRLQFRRVGCVDQGGQIIAVAGLQTLIVVHP